MKCQMTMGTPNICGEYSECPNPAKYRVPKPEMRVQYVCGVHARYLDLMFEKIGRDKRCIRLAGGQ